MQIIELLTQVGASFGIGLYTAISPCLFPLLPLMLLKSLQSENSKTRSLLVSLSLVAGILLSLAIFAVISSFLGSFFVLNHLLLQAGLGIVIVFLGFVTISQKLRDFLHLSMISIGKLPEKPTNLFNVFLVGLSYSLLAAPCTGPALLGIFVLFGTVTSLVVFLMMFIAMAIGVAIPYFALSFASGEARNRAVSIFTHSAHKIEIVVGILLVILGILLILPFYGIVFFI